MRVFQELFTTDVGLMSAAGIFITLAIGAYLFRYFIKHVQDDTGKD